MNDVERNRTVIALTCFVVRPMALAQSGASSKGPRDALLRAIDVTWLERRSTASAESVLPSIRGSLEERFASYMETLRRGEDFLTMAGGHVYLCLELLDEPCPDPTQAWEHLAERFEVLDVCLDSAGQRRRFLSWIAEEQEELDRALGVASVEAVGQDLRRRWDARLPIFETAYSCWLPDDDW